MRRLALALLLASCFNPDYPENVTCGPGGFCPEGQTCGGDGLCHAAGAPDAAAIDAPDHDAAVADGRVVVDAAAADAPTVVDAPAVNAPVVIDAPTAIDAPVVIDSAVVIDAFVPPVNAYVPPVDSAPLADAPDTTPPTATNAPTTTVLADGACVIITFSEPMNTGSVTLNGPLSALPHTTSWTGNAMTLCPTGGFWPATDPSRLLIVTGSDLAGNPMAALNVGYVSPPLEMFIASSATTAALGGLTGADATCQTEAVAAGLHGTFVAWLSTSTSDAYCRVSGRTGVRTSACGLATLPTGAGPWIRRDGQPFMELVGGVPRNYTPPIILADGTVATGATSGSGLKLWTNTSRDGSRAGASACTDWTSLGGPSTVTGDTAVVMYWTNGSTANCATPARLACMEVGQGGPLPMPTPSSHRIFVSSTSGSGNLSGWVGASGFAGLAAGDEVCQKLAFAAGLPTYGAYKAFLSTSGVSAVTRLLSNGPFVRLDGILLATNKADLTDGVLGSSVMYDETGVANDWNVYTGTLSTGAASANTCSGWSSSSAATLGEYGRSDLVSGNWTDQSSGGCGSNLRIYCVEDRCPSCPEYSCSQTCECIGNDQLCDSVANCSDGEDETSIAGCP